MDGAKEYILNFVEDNKEFSSAELLYSTDKFSKSNLNWFLRELVSCGYLSRTGRGMYSTTVRQLFSYEQAPDTIRIFNLLQARYPLASFCIYKGSILSPLQHHLSYNALTYIETDKSVTQSVFNYLKDSGTTVYIKPDKSFFYTYIDISTPGIIVKPLVSGSPLIEVNGTKGPAIEKILVDIRRDADFDYLAGEECSRMLQNALNMYSVSRSTLLRYAGRRGLKEELSKELQEI